MHYSPYNGCTVFPLKSELVWRKRRRRAAFTWSTGMDQRRPPAGLHDAVQQVVLAGSGAGGRAGRNAHGHWLLWRGSFGSRVSQSTSMHLCMHVVCKPCANPSVWHRRGVRGAQAQKLVQAAARAGARPHDVYMGIDCFGRGSFGGGGLACHIAARAARAVGALPQLELLCRRACKMTRPSGLSARCAAATHARNTPPYISFFPSFVFS